MASKIATMTCAAGRMKEILVDVVGRDKYNELAHALADVCSDVYDEAVDSELIGQKINIISGKISARISGESSITPRAIKAKDSAEKEAIEKFLEWLDSKGATYGDIVKVDCLEPEGIFDELSVKSMPTDQDGNISVEKLREYLTNNHHRNLFASIGTETYIDIDVNEAEIEE